MVGGTDRWLVIGESLDVRDRIAERVISTLLPAFATMAGLAFILGVIFVAPDQPSRMIGPTLALATTAVAWRHRRRRQWLAACRALMVGTGLTLMVQALPHGFSVTGFWVPLALVPAVIPLFGMRGAFTLLVWLATVVAIVATSELQGWIAPQSNPTLVNAAAIMIFTVLGVALARLPVLLMNDALRTSHQARERAEQAQVAELAAERRFRAVFDHAGSGLCIVDLEGRIIDLNPAARGLLGGAGAGALLCDASWWNDSAQDSLSRALARAAQQVPSAFEVTRPGSGDREEIFSVRATPFVPRPDQPAQIVVELHDITELVRSRYKAGHAQRLESLGRLAGGVAHDFNNMLTAIVGANELLAELVSVANDKDGIELTRTIRNASGRANDLTDALLRFGRRSVTQRSVLDLNALLESTVRLLRPTLGRAVALETDFQLEGAELEGDETSLQSALVNLALNSRDAMPGGGTLRIAARVVELDEASCTAMPEPIEPGPAAHIAVADTGLGIPADVLPRIFEPFFTTKPPGEGTGLGLAAVHGTIRAHEGAIGVHSRPGQGTVFDLFLPLRERADRPTKVAAPDARVGARDGALLLVDDNETVRLTVKAQLESAGFAVVDVGSVEEALDRWRSGLRVRAVVTDVVMPGKDGWDLCRVLREDDPKLPIVCMTGFTPRDLRSTVVAGETIPLLSKPLDRAALMRALFAAGCTKDTVMRPASDPLAERREQVVGSQAVGGRQPPVGLP